MITTDDDRRFSQRWHSSLSTLPILILAVGLGSLIPLFFYYIGDEPAKLAVVPAVVALSLILMQSRAVLLVIIVAMRASTEALFETSRFAIGHAQIGVGGLINGFAILLALLLAIEYGKGLWRPVFAMWGAFLVVLVLGVVFSPDKGLAVRLALQIMSSFAVFVGAYYIGRSSIDMHTCVRVVVWSAVPVVVVGYYEFASGSALVYADAGARVKSTFTHPNVLAFYLTVVIACTFYILKSKSFALSLTKRLPIAGYLVLLLGLLLLTKTRSAWIATFAIFLGYGIFFQRRYLFYLFVAGCAALLLPGVGDRLTDLMASSRNISSLDQIDSFSWRLDLWKSALSWMSPTAYPFGYGLAGFQYWSPTFFHEAGGINWEAHSAVVQLLFELGAIGIGAFAWMFYRLFKLLSPLFQIDRLCGYVLAVLALDFIVLSFSDNMLDYLSYNWYIWFLFGAGVAAASKGSVVSRKVLSRDVAYA